MTIASASSSDLDVRWVAITVALASGSGCSALTVRDAKTTPTRQVVCESTYVAPAIDAAIAIAGAALIAWGATAKQDPEGHVVTGRNFAEIPGFLLAVPFGFSSVYGFVTVGQCKGAAREAGAVAVRR